MFLRRLFQFLLALFCITGVRGGVIVTESFSYPDGPLAGSSPRWSHLSGAGGQADVSGQSLVLDGNDSESIQATLPGGPYAAGEISVMMKVKFGSLPGSGGDYFACLQGDTSGSRAHLQAFTDGAAAGKFRLGVSNDGGVVVPIGSDLELNTTYALRLGWNGSTQRATLSVGGGAAVMDTDAAEPFGVAGFVFRQAPGIGSLSVDELWIANGALPDHDQQANAQRLDLFAGNVVEVSSNLGATAEPGETPYSGLSVGGKSVWYQIFAPANALLSLSTAGSDFDTVISVYRQQGSGIAGLQALYGNDDASGGSSASGLSFQTAYDPGTYYVAVDSHRDPKDDSSNHGFFQLAISCDTSQSTFPMYEKLYSFTDAFSEDGPGGSTEGGRPRGVMFFAPDGNFYGTTVFGGKYDGGNLFRLSEAGVRTIVADFELNPAKGRPHGKLSLGNDGHFYGVTAERYYNFNTNTGSGSIFRATLQGQVTTLVQFTGTTGPYRGWQPNGGLLRGPDGSFYGTTQMGGTYNMGTLFRVTPQGGFTTLVDFTGTGPINRGRDPNGDLVWGSDGCMYGTTKVGGIGGYGTIFKVTPGGTLTTIKDLWSDYVSTYRNSSESWQNVPIRGASSAFEVDCMVTPQSSHMDGIIGLGQGAAESTGDLACMVRLGPDGRFSVISGNGYIAPVQIPYDGQHLYRVWITVDPVARTYDVRVATWQGDAQTGYFLPAETLATGCAFHTSQAGLASFDNLAVMSGTGSYGITALNLNRTGLAPECGLTVVNGDFYGTTSAGGDLDKGTVYRITPAGELSTVAHLPDREAAFERTLANSLVLAGDGNLYGTRTGGGNYDPAYGNAGSVYRVTPAGELSTVAALSGTGSERQGLDPQGLALGSNGSLYGMTYYGRANFFPAAYSQAQGTIFKVDLDGTFTTLVELSGRGGTPGRGSHPQAGLVEEADGSLLGTTERGGAHPGGTLFRLRPNGDLKIVWEFSGSGGAGGGRFPRGTLTKAADGKFYGTTYQGGRYGLGTIFRFASGTGMEEFIDFKNDAGQRGGNPTGRLVLGPDGQLYGSADSGGESNRKGVVFKASTGGILTTLRDFPVLSPDTTDLSWLTCGRDGNLYFSHFSELYRMSPNGDLTSLGTGYNTVFALEGDDLFIGTGYDTIHTVAPYGSAASYQASYRELLRFSGNGEQNKGLEPVGPLLKGPGDDGNYYGVTNKGGAANGGTVFRFNKTTGMLTTLYDFSADPLDSGPAAELMLASDGNIYGTTAGNGDMQGHGCVFRLVFPGAPGIHPLAMAPPGYHSVVLKARVNPRGSATNVVLEYRRSGDANYIAVALATNLRGAQSVELGTTLAGLERGQTYIYRFRATNGTGSTLSDPATFATLGEPLVQALPATLVSAGSATFNGTVNARSYDASVRFEWGTDPNNFPSSVAAAEGTVSGSGDTPVSVLRAGLNSGTTYYYRIVAANAGGTTVSGVQSFTTLAVPVASLDSMEALSTTRARLGGHVDAKGSALTEIRFEWGRKGIDVDGLGNPSFPSGVSATPGSLANGGSGLVAVFANTPPGSLVQGTAYHCRLRATGPGGTGISTTGFFTLSILSGFDQLFPPPLGAPDGVLTVQLSPHGIGAWRLSGELQWREPGTSITGLASGDRTIEFRPVPGYIQPPDRAVTVFSGEPAVVVDGEDTEYLLEAGAGPAGKGSLQVMLEPAASLGGLAPARWRFLGEGNAEWRGNGVTRGELIPGNYLIECEAFPGRVAPSATVSITAGATRQVTLVYPLRAAESGLGQEPVDYATVSGDELLPFGYVGQLRSPAGYSSGFAVKRRVVATAGHVVWDDGSKAAVNDMQWLFQRDNGVHEPVPQIPRGYFMESAYSAAREEPGVIPGEGTDRSQHYDYAALYFLNDAARGGFSGFLASEGGENEFLTDVSPKILAGYSTDIANPANRGRLHATPFNPAPSFALQQVPGSIDGGPYGTYFTTAIHGRAGSSGGPLFAWHQDSYYPAAIYLGGSSQTVVRAIDRRVVELFGLAETRGNGGGNSTDGGRILSVTAGGTPSRGSLKVQLQPAGLAGAGWKLLPNTSLRASGNQRDRLRPGSYLVSIAAVPGYLAPADETVNVAANTLTTISYTYRTPQEQWRYDHFASFDNSGDASDNADPDHDGRSNQEEYAAGSDPKNGADYLRVLSQVRNAGGFSVTVSGKQGRSYTLESSSTLLPGTWIARQTISPLTADQPALLLSAPPTSAHNEFYRARVEAP